MKETNDLDLFDSNSNTCYINLKTNFYKICVIPISKKFIQNLDKNRFLLNIIKNI